MPVNTAERFEALLKTEDGTVIAKGFGKIMLSEKAVRFESDFVPLYPMGTKMEIVRLHAGSEIHRFWGKVYLSHKRLMKLVSIEDQLLPGAELLYFHNMSFSATLEALPRVNREIKLFRNLRQKQEETPTVFTASITEISGRELVFQHDIDKPFEASQQFIMDSNPPLPLPRCTVEIIKPFCFGQTAAYHCSFVNLSEVERENLRMFLQKYHQRRHKLF